MGIIKNDRSNVLAECKCDICDHVWGSILERPKCCPSCKRYDWNKKEVKQNDKPTI